MKCPRCNSARFRIFDSRNSSRFIKISFKNSFRRRRKCLDCGLRFTTYEVLEEELSSIEDRLHALTKRIKRIANLLARTCNKL